MTSAAELPRILDVQDFAHARETELRHLLQSVRADVGESRFGAPLLRRHLRRRATSHRRFVIRYRPNLRLSAVYGAARGTDGNAAAVGLISAEAGRQAKRARTGRQPAIATQAADPAAQKPSPQDAGDAAPEARPTNRAMRRRPTRLQHAAEMSCAGDMVPSAPAQPAVLPALRSDERAEGGRHEPGGDGADAACAAHQQAPGGSCGASWRRLESHVWHARRMALERRWGHVLPAHYAGRGRGSRSLFAQLRRGTLLHDSSYVGCIELQGHQRDLARILRSMSDPALLDELLDTAEVISGAAEWQIFLHRPGAFPHQPLAPIRALWLTQTAVEEDDCGAATGRQDVAGTSDVAAAAEESGVAREGRPSASHPRGTAASVSQQDVDADGWATRCSLWLWVHAAAFGDVWEALHEAAGLVPTPQGARAAATVTAATITTTGSAAPAEDTVTFAETQKIAGGDGGCGGPGGSGGVVHITSRCADLRRIEVVGAGADAALARVLRAVEPPGGAQRLPVSAGASAGSGAETAAGDESLGGCIWTSVAELGPGSCGAKGLGGRWRWRWPAGAVLGFAAADPRLARPVRVGAAAADAMQAAGSAGGVAGMAAEPGAVGSQGASATAGAGPAQAQAQAPQGNVRRSKVLSQEELMRQLRLWPEEGDWTAGAAALWRRSPASTPLKRQPDAAPAGAQLRTRSAGPSPPTSAPLGHPTAIPPPLSEAGLCAARRAAREQVLRAGQGFSPAGVSVAQQPSPHQPGGCGASCPVLLVRRVSGPAAAASGEAAGWSVVLPARWVMPVWSALAFTGARSTGQAEWRQLATHFKTPCFPYDHPFTPAGERYYRNRLAELQAFAACRPLGHIPGVDAGPLADWDRLLSGLRDTRLGLAPLRKAAGGKAPTQEQCDGPQAVPAGAVTGPVSAAAVPASCTLASAINAVAEPANAPQASPSTGALHGSLLRADGRGGGQGGYGPGGGQGGYALVLRSGVALAVLAGTATEPSCSGRGEPQLLSCQRLMSPGAAGPEVKRVSKDCLHGWSLRKALKLGLLQQPHAPVPSSQQPKPPHPAEEPQEPLRRGGEVQGSSTAACKPVRTRGLVYVALRVEGRGICAAGAEVVAVYGSVQGGHREGACQLGPSSDGCMPGSEALVLGYVVSAAARGSADYPGGLAVCDVEGVARLHLHLRQACGGREALQLQSAGSGHDLGAAQGAASSGRRSGSRAATGQGGAAGQRGVLHGKATEEALLQVPAWWTGRDGAGGAGVVSSVGHPRHCPALRLWVRNPGSTALRSCRGTVLLLGNGGAQLSWT